MQYELFYLVGERQEANLDAIRESVSEMLKQEGATLVDPELTEKRKLAYEIKHQSKGVYVTRRFEMPEVDYWADEKNSEKEFGIESINNKLNLNNDVLRHLIVKTDDLPDLGAKDRRKAQEMRTEKPQQRPVQNGGRPQTQRPERKEFARPQIKKVETKPAAVEAPKVEAKKEETKDIDKQLDELLNI
jgi:ribosomal protein S6